MENNAYIKYAYITDPRNPRRVITIARYCDKENNEVHYQYAVCHPGHFNGPFHHRPKDAWSGGDLFLKDRGRLIATGRLAKSPITVKDSTRKPLAAILVHMYKNPDTPVLVKRVVSTGKLGLRQEPMVPVTNG